MGYDWINASTEARRALYRSTKRIVDEHYLGKWNALYTEVLGATFSVGQGYEDNFRAGRIGRKTAHVIAHWMKAHHPIEAGALERTISGREISTWDQFVDDHAHHDRLKIVPMDELGIVGFSRTKTDGVVSLRVGQEFCFRLRAQIGGTAIAFQQTRGAWFPLPLRNQGHAIALDAGEQFLPLDVSSGTVMPLSEDSDTGQVTFVIVIAEERHLESILARITLAHAVASHSLIALAQASINSNAFEVHSARVLFV